MLLVDLVPGRRRHELEAPLIVGQAQRGLIGQGPADGQVALPADVAQQEQIRAALGGPTDWHNIDTPVEMDPDTGDYRTRVPRSAGNMFFRVVGPDNNVDCTECGSSGQ